MEIYTKVNSIKANFMAKEYIFTVTETNILVNFRMVKNMGKELIIIRMVQNCKGSFKMANATNNALCI
jgi:sporulation protein YlmC with PRC-barrel domain